MTKNKIVSDNFTDHDPYFSECLNQKNAYNFLIRSEAIPSTHQVSVMNAMERFFRIRNKQYHALSNQKNKLPFEEYEDDKAWVFEFIDAACNCSGFAFLYQLYVVNQREDIYFALLNKLVNWHGNCTKNR